MMDDHMHPADENTIDDLSAALPRSAPHDGLRDSIMAAAAETPQDSPAPEPMAEVIPLRPRRRAVFTTFAAAACAAVIAVGITVAFTSGRNDPVPVTATATASVAAKSAPGVEGTASLYSPGDAGGTLRVALTNVPKAPSGHHYEVWVLPKGGHTMTAVGSFTPASRDVTLDLPLPTPGNYAAMDISVQANDGPPTHSGTSLAGARFT
jgi:anti-sigma-K factor RskA